MEEKYTTIDNLPKDQQIEYWKAEYYKTLGKLQVVGWFSITFVILVILKQLGLI